MRSGTWKVDIKGVPIHLSGTMQLKAAKPGAVENISRYGESVAAAHRGQAGKAGRRKLDESTAQEQDFSNRWLAGEVG